MIGGNEKGFTPKGGLQQKGRMAGSEFGHQVIPSIAGGGENGAAGGGAAQLAGGRHGRIPLTS